MVVKLKFCNGFSDALSGIAVFSDSFSIVLSLISIDGLEKLAMAPTSPMNTKNRITCTIIIPTMVANKYFRKLFICVVLNY